MPPAPDAAIVHANRYNFASGQQVTYQRVESRMLLWCIAGSGRLRVNADWFEVSADDYFWLPWGHQIEYQASRRAPFHLGGIHVIPRHGRERAVELSVPHQPGSPLTRCAWRHDMPGARYRALLRGRFSTRHELLFLANYIVSIFGRPDFAETHARRLGPILWDEIYGAAAQLPGEDLPAELQACLDFIHNQLSTGIGLADLVERFERSASHWTRLFRRHLGQTPGQYIIRRRMERAGELLRGSALPLARIGPAVGIGDRVYFSKLFKRHHGVPPAQYRRKARLL